MKCVSCLATTSADFRHLDNINKQQQQEQREEQQTQEQQIVNYFPFACHNNAVKTMKIELKNCHIIARSDALILLTSVVLQQTDARVAFALKLQILLCAT